MASDRSESRFRDGLAASRKVIKESAMLEDLFQALAPHKDSIDKVRCLAIGSFYEDFPARYQLALLLELVEFLAGEAQRTISVSVYDPVFSSEDLGFISEMGSSWTCDEKTPSCTGADWPRQALFFLPHAPLDLTEQVLKAEKPSLWLANNVIAHTDRYTKLQLHAKYPVISKLVHALESSNKDVKAPAALEEEGFKTFVSKRKKRKNRNRFVEPTVDFSSVDSYFENCSVLTSFDDGSLLKDQPWINSFSDLSLHHIR